MADLNPAPVDQVVLPVRVFSVGRAPLSVTRIAISPGRKPGNYSHDDGTVVRELVVSMNTQPVTSLGLRSIAVQEGLRRAVVSSVVNVKHELVLDMAPETGGRVAREAPKDEKLFLGREDLRHRPRVRRAPAQDVG
jgi:hypothetical protein